MEESQYAHEKLFEDFWESCDFECEMEVEFMEIIILILEILKQHYSNDFSKFFDNDGNLRSISELYKLKRISFNFDSKLSTWKTIHNLYKSAYREGKAGYLMQHLVGAKLQLRFPNHKISNESASTADKPTNRSGDFAIGNTVFHVTVSPMEGVFRKCQENLEEGLKVYLIVPDNKLAAARQLAIVYCNDQIAVESLESFVSQNIEEISEFSQEQLTYNIVNLITTYNRRVDAVEIDKSLMIELPANLKKKDDGYFLS